MKESSSLKTKSDEPKSNNRHWPISGLVPLTTHDFPGHLAAVLFLQGCVWRCEYCHNPHLWPMRSELEVSVEKLDHFLVRRRGFLDAVVISGGEATIHFQLPEMARHLKGLGYKVGLHSGGANPDNLKAALPYLDWVGFDFKTTWDRYPELTRSKGAGEKVQLSLEALLDSGVDYEIRTTLHPAWHDDQILLDMGFSLKQLGIQNYQLQEFRPEGCSSDRLARADWQLNRFLQPETLMTLGELFPRFGVRQNLEMAI